MKFNTAFENLNGNQNCKKCFLEDILYIAIVLMIKLISDSTIPDNMDNQNTWPFFRMSKIYFILNHKQELSLNFMVGLLT